ncbi:hypothetical protein [Dethiosulfatarculus sandiegensis]|uniref:Uncharacterized protein n=1 Tax=Dethiosulfatarculus sandiegensis TaxID=1429043 RepID=A0A0D2HZK3_9BACT|nr:hypothetical protein [Dethiosulfatarculus sandiegensis]KIX15708.1 hypothetical protein X474_02535 [Dethiosulfatarculus sandiegensis]
MPALRNGAGNLETLAGALGPERVLGGGTLLAEGKVRHGGACPSPIWAHFSRVGLPVFARHWQEFTKGQV